MIMATIITATMQMRRGTAAEWTAANPVLLDGEEGYETDTRRRKVGDGSTDWNSLLYLYPLPDIADQAGVLYTDGTTISWQPL